MAIAVVTGSGGLIGSESVRHLAEAGFEVIGIDNDARASFFGPEASTRETSKRLDATVDGFTWLEIDVRDDQAIESLFAQHGGRIELVVHAAAQPSHDWAARDPKLDFGINANGTLNLLEATRRNATDATFCFLSTNKVYGDTPNFLPLVEHETRLELPEDHRWYGGIDTAMSIDLSTHSLFGVSKASADLMVQEYGRYFDMPTACFRCGCLTGPAHAGAKLHGFLAYLMKCAVTGDPYTVIGYGGKQVRDNLHASDVTRAVAAFHASPAPARVYNLGGGRASNCSMLEAIEACERISGNRFDPGFDDRPRTGDHRWWISDLEAFQSDYPDWSPLYDTDAILSEIYEQNVERWTEETHRADVGT